MVNTKNTNKKSNPKRQRVAVKKHGKATDIAEFRVQLDALGLKIIEVTADGNCFFRALADQLVGNQEEHNKYRDMVVEYIASHREYFEPFIEDEIPFEEYCKSMKKDGEWAGHMELQAASLVTKRNICLHRLRSPRWYINNFTGHQSHMIHLCYHDGEHYNSVRLKEDSCEGPAKPIIIKVDAKVSANNADKLVVNKSSKRSAPRCNYDVQSVTLVMAGTGCYVIEKVEKVLQEVDGDVDAAIEFLVAEEESAENEYSNTDASSNEYVFQGDDQTEDYKQIAAESSQMKIEEKVCSNIDLIQFQFDETSTQTKRISGVKECSCGSKKTHKHCRGTDVRKPTPPAINSKHLPSKGKKNIKSKKKEAIRDIPQSASTSSEPLPDLGALCI